MVVAFRPAILDRHVLALDQAGFVEAFAKTGDEWCPGSRRCTAEKPYYRHRRLLRARSDRPCCQPTKIRDEFAPPHLGPEALEQHLRGLKEHAGRGRK